jgi:hypothetical protein
MAIEYAFRRVDRLIDANVPIGVLVYAPQSPHPRMYSQHGERLPQRAHDERPFSSDLLGESHEANRSHHDFYDTVDACI